MKRDDAIRLRHILDAASEALSFSTGKSREDLEADRKLSLSLVKEIEIIGEAASKVGETTKAALPRLPWGQMVSMRNRLVHAYFDVDHEIVWNTVVQELPPLIAEIRAALEAEPQ